MRHSGRPIGQKINEPKSMGEKRHPSCGLQAKYATPGSMAGIVRLIIYKNVLDRWVKMVPVVVTAGCAGFEQIRRLIKPTNLLLVFQG